jgi:hypothetical protein
VKKPLNKLNGLWTGEAPAMGRAGGRRADRRTGRPGAGTGAARVTGDELDEESSGPVRRTCAPSFAFALEIMALPLDINHKHFAKILSRQAGHRHGAC